MDVRLLMAATIVVSVAAGCASHHSPPAAPVASTPTAGAQVVLDRNTAGWRTSAWFHDGALCVRAVRVQRRQGHENEATFCDPAPTALQKPGPPLIPAKPTPYLFPLDPASEQIILVGTVRGAVNTVTVTMSGHTATAAVHTLPTHSGRRIGAYAVWLPRGTASGSPGTNLDDITAVTGRDGNGRIIAKI